MMTRRIITRVLPLLLIICFSTAAEGQEKEKKEKRI